MGSFLKVKLNHSAICRTKRQKDTLRGLGLRHIGQERILKDTPPIRGLIQKVIHLVSFEESKKDSLAAKKKVETYKLGTKVAKKAKAAPKKEAAKPAAKKEEAAPKEKKAAAKPKAAVKPKGGTATAKKTETTKTKAASEKAKK